MTDELLRFALVGLRTQAALDQLGSGPHHHGPPPVCTACRDGDHETQLAAGKHCTCPCHGRPR